ncbi:MAG: ABC transporter permease [Asticcacaulis sp.]|nr:ABC transporter permease [Asticcacaulis sp.]
MFRSFVIAFYRSLARHPLYGALNGLGLSFGVAVFIILTLFVRFETSYEQWLPDAGAIYEIATLHVDDGKIGKRHFMSAGGTLDAIHKEFPDVEGTRMAPSYMIVRQRDQLNEEEGQLVDANAFRLFQVDWIAGEPATALRPGAIILSEAMATKYFGRRDVVGRILNLRDDLGPLALDGPPPPWRAYIVSGVLKNPPANSTLHFDFVRLLTSDRIAHEPYWNDWGGSIRHTFLKLRSPEDVAAVARRLDKILDDHGEAAYLDTMFRGQPRHSHLRLVLAPITAEHLADGKAVAGLWLLGVVGMLALVMALINYINLATARAGLRAREVAVRKALGASVAQIRRQFLIEAGMVSLAAGLLGFSLVELLLPLLNTFGGLSLRLDYVREAPLLVGLAVAVVASGVLAGLYPAVVLSGYEPAHVLASARSPSGGRLGLVVREGLVVIQFAVVTIFFIVVIGFSAQIQHMRSSDLGFSRQGLLMTNSTISDFLSEDQVLAVQAQWRSLPDVVSVTAGPVPGRYFQYSSLTVTPDDGLSPPMEVKAMAVDNDFFGTYGTRILAGRAVDSSDKVAEGETMGLRACQINININRAAARALGYGAPQNAIGHSLADRLTRLRIVGVVEDQRFASPTEAIGPVVYLVTDVTIRQSSTILRFRNVPDEVMRARMDAVWRPIAPGLPLTIESGDHALQTYYEADRRMTRLFTFGALVAGLIGTLGLYGMAAFNTSNRAREIGLRKAMGASRRRIAALLVLQFLRPVAVASLAAWPLAWLILGRWLSQFDDSVGLHAWFFAAGSGVALFIAIVTVAGLTLAAANAAPGKTLRHE